MVPLADLINHHNVEALYETVCKDLHRPLKHLSHLQDKVIETNISDLQAQLGNELENYSQNEKSYINKTRMVKNVDELYEDENPEKSGSESELCVISKNIVKRRYARIEA